MNLFGDYSIETASCHPSSLFRDRDNIDDVFSDPFQPVPPISPRDNKTSYPLALANMTALTREFSLQKLDRRASTEAESHYTFASDERSEPSSPTSSRFLPSRSAPCWRRRMQRQSDSRLQCDPSHLRSISELVERMIDSGDQCGISMPKRFKIVPPPISTTAADEDDEDEESDPSTPRSLSSTSSNGARVPNTFTFDSFTLSHRRSSEALGPMRDSRVQKSRHRRSHHRDRRQ